MATKRAKNKEETLVIVKPDAIAKGLVGLLIEKLEENGLRVLEAARVVLPSHTARDLYSGLEKERQFEAATKWIASAPVLLLKVEGPDAIVRVKYRIIGKYPSGIRGSYSEDSIKNVAHSATDAAAVERELKLLAPFFEEQRISYVRRFTGVTVFALTGMSESGKSTVGKYFASKGIPRLKIKSIFQEVCRHLSPDETPEKLIAEKEKHDPYALWDEFIRELSSQVHNLGVKIASMESLYGDRFAAYLKLRMREHLCLMFVDIPIEIRLRRQMSREKLSSIEDAKKLLLPRDEVKRQSGIPRIKEISDEVIDNSDSIRDLYMELDRLIVHYSEFSRQDRN